MNAPLSPIEPDARRALCAALEGLEQARSGGRHWAMPEALRALAGVYRQLQAWPSALSALEQALRWARATGAADDGVDLQCEIVETLALQAEADERERPGSGRPARERARDLVFHAWRQAAHVADARWEVTVLLRLSDVLDRFGDRDEATALQVRALQLTVGSTFAPADLSAADAALLRCH